MPSWDFESAYRENSRMVYWAAYGILKSEADALDVSQEVFLRALRNEDKLAVLDEARQRGWLYRVAVNLCMDKKRGEKREFPAEDTEIFDREDGDGEGLPEAAFMNAERKKLLREAIDALPAVYGESVLLHYFSGLSIDEIAALTGSSPGTIKSRLSRARQKLYDILEKDGERYA